MLFAALYESPLDAYVNRDYQGECFDKMEEALSRGVRKMLGVKATGLGKAQPLSENVLTPYGWRKMGSLMAGEIVFDMHGKPCIIEGVYPQGVRPVYKVCFSDNTEVFCDTQHIWYAQTRSAKNRGRAYKEYTAQELKSRIQTDSYYIPVCDPIEMPRTFQSIDPYFIGMLIGDGGMTIENRIVFSSIDQELIDYWSDYLDYWGMKIKRSSGCDYLFGPKIRYSRVNPFRDNLVNMGLTGKRSEEKFIPHEYTCGSIEQRLELLRGLMDTDGTTREDGHTSFSTSSYKLAEQVCDLVRGLGGSTRIRTKKTTCLDNYRITVNIADCPFRLARKADLWSRCYTHNPTKRIVSIEDAGEDLCQCISVDSPTSSYITSGHSVTHNTVVMAGLPKRFREWAKKGILILVHRDELVHQTVEKFQRSNPHLKIGIEKAKYRADIDCDIVVASVQTLGRLDRDGLPSRRLLRFARRFGIVVVDETHHVTRGSRYQVVLDQLGLGPTPSEFSKSVSFDRFLLGLTATPKRHDGFGLGTFYEEIVFNYDLKYGVENGWLVKPLIFPEHTNVDISSVKETAGDFNQKQLAEAVNVERRNSLIVDAYLRATRGDLKGQIRATAGSAIAFCSGIAHAKSLASSFLAAGVRAVSIDKDTPADTRKRYVKDYKRGAIKVICNCGVLTEGFDASICDVILLARPTTSDSLYAQMVGRGTRPHCELPQKIVSERLAAIKASDKPSLFVIDFVDNHKKNNLATAASLFGYKDDTIPLPAKPQRKDEEPTENEELKFEVDEDDLKPSRFDRSVKSTAERNLRAESLDYAHSVEGLSHFNWTPTDHLKDQVDSERSHELMIPSYKKPQALRLLKVPEGYKVQHVNLKTGAVNTSENSMPTLETALQHCEKWILAKTNPNERALMMREAKWRKKSGYATPSQISMIGRDLGVTLPKGTKLKFKDAVSLIDSLQSQKVSALVAEHGK